MSKQEKQYTQKKQDSQEHFLFRSMYFNTPEYEQPYYPVHTYVGFNKNQLKELTEKEIETALIKTYINIYKYDNLV